MKVIFEVPRTFSTNDIIIELSSGISVEEGVTICLRQLGKSNELYEGRIYCINNKVVPSNTLLKDNDRVSFHQLFLGG